MTKKTNAKKTYSLIAVSLLAGFISSKTFRAFALDVLPDAPPVPADNPMTKAKINLGKELYFDARLSRTGKISCNSCHDLSKSGGDNRSVSLGVDGKTGKRSAPTVFNAAFLSSQFWDGRAPTLEEQAKGPMINPVEMGMANHDEVVGRIRKIPGYQKEFAAVFGGDNPVTIDNAVKAIATFERTLVTPDSPHDRFMKGDKSAMSVAAQRGMQTVQTVGCTACHMGPNFSGPATLPMGQGFFQKFPTFEGTEYEKKYHLTDDLGRYEATHHDADKHLWRVPTWRNVAITAPYFHNGSVKTLDEAVRVMAKTQLNKTLPDSDVKDIVEFLKSLTGKKPKIKVPKLPEG